MLLRVAAAVAVVAVGVAAAADVATAYIRDNSSAGLNECTGSFYTAHLERGLRFGLGWVEGSVARWLWEWNSSCKCNWVRGN